MELKGAKALFTRSIVLHGVRYTGYYGDGDSKAYGEVKAYYGDDHSIIKWVYRTLPETCRHSVTNVEKRQQGVEGIEWTKYWFRDVSRYFRTGLKVLSGWWKCILDHLYEISMIRKCAFYDCKPILHHFGQLIAIWTDFLKFSCEKSSFYAAIMDFQGHHYRFLENLFQILKLHCVSFQMSLHWVFGYE